MNTGTPDADWQGLRSRLRREYGWLTVEDLDLMEDDWETLVGRLQEHYGYTREHAEQEAERFLLEQRL